VTKIYDGTDTNPVELCVRTGTDINLVITTPTGASWDVPTVTPEDKYPAIPSRSGHSVMIKIHAVRRGTAQVTVPKTAWRLSIAVI
jgi:hypothetical protein